MDKNLRDMIDMSRTAGADNRLVQAGGGNTSVKTDGERLMYVKASGTSLAEMEEGQGYRTVDVEQCRTMLDDDELQSMEAVRREEEVANRLKACCADDNPGRPSVETSLHALLGHCVLHTHPSVVNGLLCAREGRKALRDLFGDLDCPYLYVPYVDPGYPLAVRLAHEIDEYKSQHGHVPTITFLENHGLFASADGPEEALELTRFIFGSIESEWRRRTSQRDIRSRPPSGTKMRTVRQICAGMRRAYAEMWGSPVLVQFSENKPVKSFLMQSEAKDLIQANPLMPDQVVYCKKMPIWLDQCAQRQDCVTETQKAVHAAFDGESTPRCIVADGLGLFAAAPDVGTVKAALATMEATLETLSVASHFGGPRGMSDEAVAYIRDWEVEKFRQKVAGGAAGGGELAGKVAVCVAAGGRLGRRVAMRLAREGMTVVAADLQADRAKYTVRMIQEADLPGKSFPVRVDVRSEEEVEKLFDWVITHLGGLDLLVNCAVAPSPGSLLDCPTSDWLRSIDTDVTGYFLLGRKAARTMKRQGTGGCIINVAKTEKPRKSAPHQCWSPLVAIESQLARKWAEELKHHNIRINGVCVGEEPAVVHPQDAEANEGEIEESGVVDIADDIASSVAFLAGPTGARITGQTLHLCGRDRMRLSPQRGTNS